MKVKQRTADQQTEGCLSAGRRVKIYTAVAILTVPLGLQVSPSAHAAVDTAPGVTKPAAVVDADSLVRQLSDESFFVREKATESLWRLGREALPSLRRAASGTDPESSDRASELVLYITAGVLFDSPREVKQLVLKFSLSDLDDKLVILRKLTELGQWKQVLHLAQAEKSPEAKAQMADIVQKTASRATRDAIAKGDLELAAQILELTAHDPQSLIMRAWFYRHLGQLDAQLKKAAGLAGKKGALWRMSLHRVGGNIPAAMREADQAGQQGLADALRLLGGDAAPWLLRNSRQSNLDVIYSLGSRIQIERLDGKEKQAAVTARELARLARDEDTTARAASCLAANGFRQQAIDLLRRHDVEAAFNYYDSIEAPQLCLQVLGIPENSRPPYTDWVKTFTANAIEQEDEKLYDQLILLANFLVTRGERAHALAVLTPMMTALEKDGSDDWFELIPTMAIYGLGAEALHFIKQRGNEDGETELSVKKMLSRVPSKSLSHVWEELKKRNDQKLGPALRQLGLLSGLIDDPDNETDQLHKALMAEVVAAAAEVKEERMAALFSFAVKRNDLAEASRMADALAKVSDRWTRSKTYLDAALLRWKVIEPGMAATAKDSPGDYYNLMQWYIALHKLGRGEDAEAVYKRVMLLSMGNSAILSRFAWELHEAGFEKKAAGLWLQAAALADPTEAEFDQAIVYLAHYGQDLYRTDRWQLAAALTEASAQLTMRGRTSATVNMILRTRFYAEFCKGMAQLRKGQKSSALKTLDAARKMIPGDGSLADEFFPILRKEGLGKTYDLWFNDSYQHVQSACNLYPKAHNSQNTAAWLAARAVRKLEAAQAHAEAAIKIRPTQGAYLDTMAEVWFAKGNRAKAVEWSQKAVAGSITNAKGSPRTEGQVIANYKQLYKQLERFKSEPMPK